MIGKRLKELRQQKGLTQPELAKRLNISVSSIGMYETDAREPSDEIKTKIADFFNVTVDYLLGIDREYGAASIPEEHQAKQIEKHNARLQKEKYDGEDEWLYAFNYGYNDLDEADKEVLKATFDAYLKARKGDK